MGKRSVRLFVLLLLVGFAAACAHFQIPEQTQLLASSGSHTAECPGWQMAQTEQPSALEPEFSLFSWNIYKGNRKGWAQALVELTQDSDIALLQEAVTPQLEAFWQGRGWHSLMVHAFSSRGQPAGVQSAARVAADSACGVREAEPLIALPKSLLATRYPITSTSGDRHTLLVVNLHSVNFTWETFAYQNQLSAIHQLVASHVGPVVVGGDFNTWSGERQRLVGLWAEPLGLEAVTFTPDRRVRFAGRALDHVFYRGLTLVSSQTLQLESSDHNPLSVRFKFEQSPT